ncbi:MAG: hypothetical protein NMNS01_22600 [Nitrosomonas sp.]|nr:MAG: hypothetical protein NMNS01_22600 [Nitrosomonas sp.]
MSKITITGIVLAKNVFHPHAIDSTGRKVKAINLSRLRLTKYLHRSERIIVAMVACASAHHWDRLYQLLGHEVRLISPQFVKSNDRNDARAICEAAQRPDMHFVPIKTVEQQAVMSLHRVREMLIGQRRRQ